MVPKSVFFLLTLRARSEDSGLNSRNRVWGSDKVRMLVYKRESAREGEDVRGGEREGLKKVGSWWV